MENASNALKIAAGVIMAMLILSLLVYGIVRLRNYQNAVDNSKQIEQANKFNQRFESYNKQIVTGYELVSLGNLTRDMNNRYNGEKGYKTVNVYVKLINSDEHLPGSGSKTKKVTIDGSKYFNLVTYLDDVGEAINRENKNASSDNDPNSFKKMYFRCTYVGYNDSFTDNSGSTQSTDHTTPRVYEMRFVEITKDDNRQRFID